MTLVDKSLTKADTTYGDLFFLLAQKALLEAYRNHGSPRSIRKGLGLISHLQNQLYAIPYMGPIHQTVILKSIGNFFLHIGDQAATRQFAQQALTLSNKAGLLHQVKQLQKDFRQVL
jgi:hypothetical protein